MSTEITVSPVTYASHELGLRLAQQWRFLQVEGEKVLIHGEPVAAFDKRGPRVRLAPIGPREVVRWVAWAIQSLSPEAEAIDEEVSSEPIAEAPMSDDEVETAVRDMEATRNDAIAKEADPSGGAHEATALVTYLVKRGDLELAGPASAVVRAVMPVLGEVDEDVGAKLEDALLDLDEVDELYAGAEELAKIVTQNKHIFDR